MYWHWRTLKLAGAVLALAGCQDEAAAPQKPRPVRTVTVEAADMNEVISQTGEVQPRVETDLGFRVNGRVARRLVDVGARVNPGDVLAVLDDGDIGNEVRAAEADLASAEASATAARAAWERQKTLYEKQIVAKAALESAEAQWRSAAARQDAASATLQNVRNKLDYTRLVSTEAGVVTAVGANAGQVVGSGQMIVRVATEDSKDAVFNVSERLIGGATRGLVVRVSLVADPTVTVLGSLREISPTADAATRTYRVRVSLPSAPEAMTFGATVNGSVEFSGGRLIAVPGSAITSQSGAPAVFVVNPQTSRLVLKPVVVTRYADGAAIIQTGLAAGEKVVTAGVSKLRPDELVGLGEDAR